MVYVLSLWTKQFLNAPKSYKANEKATHKHEKKTTQQYNSTEKQNLYVIGEIREFYTNKQTNI